MALLAILIHKTPTGLCFQLTLVESLQQWWHYPACLVEEGFGGCRHVGWIHGELLLRLKGIQKQVVYNIQLLVERNKEKLDVERIIQVGK